MKFPLKFGGKIHSFLQKKLNTTNGVYCLCFFAGPKAFAFFGVCFSAWSTLVKSSVFKYFSNWLITYYSLAGVVCVLADFVFVFLNLSVAQSRHPYLTPNVNQDPLTFTWLEISVYKVWIHCIKVEFKQKCPNVPADPVESLELAKTNQSHRGGQHQGSYDIIIFNTLFTRKLNRLKFQTGQSESCAGFSQGEAKRREKGKLTQPAN